MCANAMFIFKMTMITLYLLLIEVSICVILEQVADEISIGQVMPFRWINTLHMKEYRNTMNRIFFRLHCVEFRRAAKTKCRFLY